MSPDHYWISRYGWDVSKIRESSRLFRFNRRPYLYCEGVMLKFLISRVSSHRYLDIDLLVRVSLAGHLHLNIPKLMSMCEIRISYRFFGVHVLFYLELEVRVKGSVGAKFVPAGYVLVYKQFAKFMFESS